MSEQEESLVSDGMVDLYYENNRTQVNISPKSFTHVLVKHDLAKCEGLLHIITDEYLREKGIYIIDTVLMYDGKDERLKLNLYNYGTKPYIIEDKDIICSLILNAIEDGD